MDDALLGIEVYKRVSHLSEDSIKIILEYLLCLPPLSYSMTFLAHDDIYYMAGSGGGTGSIAMGYPAGRDQHVDTGPVAIGYNMDRYCADIPGYDYYDTDWD